MPALRFSRLVAVTVVGLLATGTLAATPATAAKPPLTPVPVVTSKPANPTNQRQATFEWTTVANTTYTCALDGGAAAPCSGQATYGPLSDGVHNFVLRAKARNQRPNAFVWSWRVHGTPPGAPSVAAVPTPTRSTSASISFTNTDPAATGHECSLDGASFITCTSPHPVTSLGDGPHTLSVRAVDAFANRSAPASVGWVVDATAPENVFLTGPAGATNDPAPSVTFSANGATHYDCSVDGAPPVPCNSPYVVPGVTTEGAHSLTVRAFDAVGNVGQPATAVWVLDTTPPATPLIVTGPAALTNQTSATFEVSTDGASALQCRLDDGTWTACTSPVQLVGLGPVQHTLQVRARDAAGNISGVAGATWLVDTTAPFPAQFTGGPLGASNERQPVFTFVGTDPSTDSFECALDGGAFVACESGEWPFATDVSGDGMHVFSVRALDLALNSSSPVAWSWVVDTTPPAMPVFSTSPAVSGADTTAVFAFASEVGSSYACSVDGAAATGCTSPVTLRDLTLGQHFFSVVAEDAAHNRSEPAQHSWTVTAADTPSTPPSAPGDPAPVTTPVVPPAPSTDSPAAVATVTPSRALMGSSSVVFSRAVRGVTGSSVLLRAGAAARPVLLSCTDASGTATACATGQVRRALVTPTQPLMPGQTYVLSVTSGVVDTTGRGVVPAGKDFRASTDEQETSLGAKSTWRTAAAAGAYGKRFLTESRAGASMTTTVRGPRVTWYTMTGPSQGIATVYVDDVKKAQVSNYSPRTRWHVGRTLTGLGDGTHSLRVVVTGRKAAASTGTGVVVDAVRSAGRLVANPRSSAAWGLAKATGASGGRYVVTGTAGATSSFTFRGTSVSWVTRTSPSSGKAKVFVDGVLVARVDNYSARSAWNVRRTVTGLSDRAHTVKVVVTGAKSRAARGTDVVVDRWLVG
jgi:hypothetical protein